MPPELGSDFRWFEGSVKETAHSCAVYLIDYPGTGGTASRARKNCLRDGRKLSCLPCGLIPVFWIEMETPPSIAFHPFSSSHLTVLGVFALAAATIITVTRAGWLRAARVMEFILVGALLLEWPINLWVSWRYELIDSSNSLPLHLCDMAAYLGVVALITRRPEACELLYFWGLAGTLQGLITPSLTLDWPHPRFVMFFMLHCGVVLAALQIVLGRGVTPRRGAAIRAVGWLAVYAAVIGGIDALIRAWGATANYGFLCHKPETASLFDYLGPWPWYIGSVLALSFVLFLLLDLPFMIRRRRQSISI